MKSSPPGKTKQQIISIASLQSSEDIITENSNILFSHLARKNSGNMSNEADIVPDDDSRNNIKSRFEIKAIEIKPQVEEFLEMQNPR